MKGVFIRSQTREGLPPRPQEAQGWPFCREYSQAAIAWGPQAISPAEAPHPQFWGTCSMVRAQALARAAQMWHTSTHAARLAIIAKTLFFFPFNPISPISTPPNASKFI